MTTPARTTPPNIAAATGNTAHEIPALVGGRGNRSPALETETPAANVLRSPVDLAGRVVFRRRLDLALAALVVLCLVLAAFVWWRLLS